MFVGSGPSLHLPVVPVHCSENTLPHRAVVQGGLASAPVCFFLWKFPLVLDLTMFQTPTLDGGCHQGAGAESRGAVEKTRPGGPDNSPAAQSGPCTPGFA